MNPFRLSPNGITAARIIAAPLIALLLLSPAGGLRMMALFLYLLAAASDWLDGYLARSTGAQSLAGTVFDPIADKLLVGAVLLALAYNGALHPYGLMLPALAILFREILISGLREYVTLRAKADPSLRGELPVSKLGKTKTVVQLTALGLLIAAPPGNIIAMLGALGLWVAGALSLYSAVDYWRSATRGAEA